MSLLNVSSGITSVCDITSEEDTLPPKKKAKKATGECANYNKECVIVLIGGMRVVV